MSIRSAPLLVLARLTILTIVGLVSRAGIAGETLVAVATNFASVAERLEVEFESETGHELRFASGSTGRLYAQIVNGAPYDVFLAGDRARPLRLIDSGRALESSRRTYARGRLVLWSAAPGRLVAPGDDLLRQGAFRRLAIANPELAPYGAAAREALEAMGLWETLSDRVVMGENIGQTFTLVATGNAELGFVAASQVVDTTFAGSGSRWVVPTGLHAPIRQDVVMLRRGAGNPAAQAFLEFLATETVRRTIRASGYDVD